MKQNLFDRNSLYVVGILIFCFISFLFLVRFGELEAGNYNSSELKEDGITKLYGLIGQNLTASDAQRNRLHNTIGFLVNDTLPGSPAEKGGIKKGDILFEINNMLIRNKFDLERYSKDIHYGDHVNLTIFRPNSSIFGISGPHIENVEIYLVPDNMTRRYQNSSLFEMPQKLNFSSYGDLDFHVRYPSTWEIKKVEGNAYSLARIEFVSLKEDPSDTFREKVTIRSYNETNVSNIPYNAFKILENTSYMTADGRKAYNITYTPRFDIDRIYEDILIPDDSKIYRITYSAQGEKFEFYRKSFERMILSFHINHVKIYESFDLGLRLKYPDDFFEPTSVSRYSGLEFKPSLEFKPKNSDQEYQSFKVEIMDYFAKDKTEKTIIDELVKSMNESSINFTIFNKNSYSSPLDNDDPRILFYSYYSPSHGSVKGEKRLTKIGDKMYLFTYEAIDNVFFNSKFLVNSMIDSTKFFQTQRYDNFQFGITTLYPSNWKVFSSLNSNSNEYVRFLPPDDNESYFDIQSSNSNEPNQLHPCPDLFSNNRTSLSDDRSSYTDFIIPTFPSGENCIPLKVRIVTTNTNSKTAGVTKNELYVLGNLRFNEKSYQITFKTRNDKFYLYRPTVENIMNSMAIMNYTSDRKEGNLLYKGLGIIHPFEIRYNSCWVPRDENEIERGFILQPSNCGNYDTYSSMAVTYWNQKDNGKSLDDSSLEDLKYLEENFREIAINKNITKLNNAGIKGTTVLYIFKDVYGNEYTEWIFYGKDSYKTNLKITFFTTLDLFPRYWLAVRHMIESINVLGPVEKTDLPHGIRVGANPAGIAFDSIRNLLYVVNQGSRTISIVNGTTNKEISQIDLSSDLQPRGVGLDEKNDILYITHPSPNSIQNSSRNGMITIVQNVSTSRKITDIPIAGDPLEVVVNPNTGKSYIGDPDSDSITVLNGTNKKNATIQLISKSSSLNNAKGIGLAIDKNRNIIYVADSNTGNVTLIDGITDKMIQNITIRKGSDTELGNACLVDIALDPEVHRAYVLDTGNCGLDTETRKGRLVIIDSLNNEVIDVIEIGYYPNNVAVNPQTHRIYVANQLNDSVTIIDPIFHYPTEIQVGAGPNDIVANPKMSTVYVTNEPTDTVTIIGDDRRQVVQSVDFGIIPSKAGMIKCGDTEYDVNSSDGLLPDKTHCEAQPKAGYSFESWSGDVSLLSDSIPTTTSAFLQPLKTFLTVIGLGSDNGVIEIRSSGDLVANFRPVPPPIPPEYWAGFIGISVSIFTGYIAPNVAKWINSMRQRKCMIAYYDKVDQLPKDSYYLKNLADFKKEIIHVYANGKISEKQYEVLNKKVSDLESQHAVK